MSASGGKRLEGKHENPSRKKFSTSKLIAFGVLALDVVATIYVLYLCKLAIIYQFTGALPYLTTLIGALQAATGYILGHYFKKSAAENSAGGIVYDTAIAEAKAVQKNSGYVSNDLDEPDL